MYNENRYNRSLAGDLFFLLISLALGGGVAYFIIFIITAMFSAELEIILPGLIGLIFAFFVFFQCIYSIIAPFKKAELLSRIFDKVASLIDRLSDWLKSKEITWKQAALFILGIGCLGTASYLTAIFSPIMFSVATWSAALYGLLCFSLFILGLVLMLLIIREHNIVNSYKKYLISLSEISIPILSDTIDLLKNKLTNELKNNKDLSHEEALVEEIGKDLLSKFSSYHFFAPDPPSYKKEWGNVSSIQTALKNNITKYFESLFYASSLQFMNSANMSKQKYFRQLKCKIIQIKNTRKLINSYIKRLFELNEPLPEVKRCLDYKTQNDLAPVLKSVDRIYTTYQNRRKAAFLSCGIVKNKESTAYKFMEKCDVYILKAILQIDGSCAPTKPKQNVK